MQLLPDQLNRDREGAPTTYLITWACYGAWLPGSERGRPANTEWFRGPPSRSKHGKGAAVQEPHEGRSLFVGFGSEASSVE